MSTPNYVLSMSMRTGVLISP